MPTYEYICRACGHDFEVFQSITAPTLKKCPKCGKPKVERKIGIGAGILFKGGGFYETDYRSENYKKGQEAETKAATPAPEAKPSTDAKPDAKADVKSAAAETKPPVEAPRKDPKPDSSSNATHPSRVGRGRGNIARRGKRGK